MKWGLLKSTYDKKSFKIFEALGVDVYKVENLEETDLVIKTMIKQEYQTIVITNEIAGFSEDIIKKYTKTDDIKIIIIPPNLNV